MEFITNNVDMIIALFTMVLTLVLGSLSKKCSYINNNIIIIQNIVVGLFASGIYYIITKDFNIAITLSGLFAETGYNLFHNVQKLTEERKNSKSNNSKSVNNNEEEKPKVTIFK